MLAGEAPKAGVRPRARRARRSARRQGRSWRAPAPRPTGRPLSSRASVVVFPTREAEGVTRAVIEAAAAGALTVVADVGAAREIVVAPPYAPPEQRSGWLVPAGDAPALAEAIEAALTLGASAREATRRRSRDRVAARLFAGAHDARHIGRLCGSVETEGAVMARTSIGYSARQIGLHWLVFAARRLPVVHRRRHDGPLPAPPMADGRPTVAPAWATVHRRVGVLVLMLMLWRLGLRHSEGAPPPAKQHPALQGLASAVHVALYLDLILGALVGLVAYFLAAPARRPASLDDAADPSRPAGAPCRGRALASLRRARRRRHAHDPASPITGQRRRRAYLR